MKIDPEGKNDEVLRLISNTLVILRKVIVAKWVEEGEKFDTTYAGLVGKDMFRWIVEPVQGRATQAIVHIEWVPGGTLKGEGVHLTHISISKNE